MDLTLSMVSEDSTSRVIVLPVTVLYRQYQAVIAMQSIVRTGLDEDLHLVLSCPAFLKQAKMVKEDMQSEGGKARCGCAKSFAESRGTFCRKPH